MADGIELPDQQARRPRAPRGPTAVAIATRRRELAAALIDRIAGDKSFRIVGDPVRTPARLLRYLEKQRPRVLLLDQPLFDRLGDRSKRALHAALPGLRVLLLCDHAHSGLLEEVVRNRFHGFLLTSLAPESCAKAISKVGRGELWLPRALLEKAVLEYTQPRERDAARPAPVASLTGREIQALEQLCRGLTNKQIAGELGISEDTVKKHLHNIYGKLGVRNRSQLIANQTTR